MTSLYDGMETIATEQTYSLSPTHDTAAGSNRALLEAFSMRDDRTPWITALLTASAFLLLESGGIHVAGPSTPLSWGVAKDVVDAAIIVLFPWNGWVFLFPLVAGIAAKWGSSKLLLLWLAMSVGIGIGDTVISFDLLSLGRILKGVGFYLLIFAVVGAAILAINGLLVRRMKCRQ